MARFLLAPETFNLGETSRAVELAEELRARGHATHFIGFSVKYEAFIRENGFTLDLLSPRLSDKDAKRMIDFDQGRSIRLPLTEEIIRERVRSEQTVIKAWQPDAVIIGTTVSQFISARSMHVPLIYAKPYALSRGQIADLRSFPVLSGTSRPAAAVNRLCGIGMRLLFTHLTWRPAGLAKVAAENNVSLGRTTLDVLSADLNLICSLEPVLQDVSLGPTDVAVGPIYLQSDAEMPTELVELVQRKQRPLVYVAMGSSANRKLVLRALAEVAQLDVDIIAPVKSYLRAADVASMPDNVHIWNFLPAAKVSEFVDASVIHGGEGTVQTACRSGAPFVGIGLQTEQRWNIDFCVQQGNAMRFTARDLAQGRLPAMVAQCLTRRDLKEAAQRMRSKTAQLHGVTKAVDEMEYFIAT